MTPSIALLTDGRANVDLAGIANRAQAAEDAKLMARAIRAKGLSGLVIDTGLRPRAASTSWLGKCGCPTCRCPRADARAVSSAVDAALEGA
jgi:magnesium chelatase subunit D